METSLVRKRVIDTIEHARRTAAARRSVVDEASREYAAFLDTIAVPLFRQVASALKASGYPFSVFTPSGSVRLISDRTSEDFVDLSLDTSGDQPTIVLRISRARGRRILETERPVGKPPIRDMAEGLLLDVLLKELEPFVEK